MHGQATLIYRDKNVTEGAESRGKPGILKKDANTNKTLFYAGLSKKPEWTPSYKITIRGPHNPKVRGSNPLPATK